jgi:hypothetical protein
MPSKKEESALAPVKASGLKTRRNADGSRRYYWFASKPAVAKGYEPVSVTVAGDDTTEIGRKQIETEAQRMTTDMLRWLDAQEHGRHFDGTLASLIRRYQVDEESPYQDVKWNTRRAYDGDLKRLSDGAGKRLLATLKNSDFHRWHEAALAPKVDRLKADFVGPPAMGARRVRSAHGLMTMVRLVISYGVQAEIEHCARIDAILSKMRFTIPKARKNRPTYEQAVAIIAKAHELGAPSVALAQALQFDGMFRQSNVVGQWRPMELGEGANGRILFNGRVWEDGLSWRHLGDDMVIRFETTKRDDRPVEIDLTLCSLALAEISRMPIEQRMGPLIVDERTSRPYLEKAFSKLWRKVADAAGVPKNVWNRDSRSGGITEGQDAGADIVDLSKQAAHADPSFTARVYARGPLEASRRIGRLRTEHRTRKTENSG